MNQLIKKPRYKNVLLIEDDEVDTFIAIRIIKSALLAEEVISKASVKEALDYLKALINTPDQFPEVIFLDMGMPGMDGFDFLKEFRMYDEITKSRSKVVVLTNFIYPESKTLSKIQDHFDVHSIIYKPLTVEALAGI